MKKTYSHIGQTERDRMEALLDAGHNQSEVAKILKVDKSTISREKKRKQKGKKYEATVAHQKAKKKRRFSKYQGMKVEAHPELKEHIIAELRKKRSPDEIAGRMDRDGFTTRIGKDAIYRWLYSSWGQQYAKYLCTKRYKPRKRKENQTRREMIPERVSIRERPLGATNRTRYAHFEVDTAVAPKKVINTEAVAITTELKSKLMLGTKITSLSPQRMTKAMKKLKKKAHMKSMTLDNGIENKHHTQWDVPTYFADPHSPWQKPLVENSIGLLRRWFFKKGTDWSTVSEYKLQKALSTLNKKYRKSLGYASAIEVAMEHGILLPTTQQRVALHQRI